MKRERRLASVRFLVVLFVSAAILFPACGKKGDPIPAGAAPPDPVADVRVLKTEKAIVLSWSSPSGKRPPVEIFKIFRQEGAPDGVCPGCPKEFSPLANIGRSDPRYDGGGGKMKFTDDGIRAGRLYRYRIVGCTAGEICSRPAETAEIPYFKP